MKSRGLTRGRTISKVADILARNLTDAQRDVLRRLSDGQDIALDDAVVPILIRYGFAETTVQGFSAKITLTPYGALVVQAIKRLDRGD